MNREKERFMKDNEYEYTLDAKVYPDPEPGIKGFWNNWGTFSLIVLVILSFRSIIIEPFKIPSGSMIPTLLIGDFILVDKTAYGYKVPFSDWLGKPVYLYRRALPKRGEVIIFKYPRNESLNYIKRLIGVPGDKIEVINKVLYVNDVLWRRSSLMELKLWKIWMKSSKTIVFAFLIVLLVE